MTAEQELCGGGSALRGGAKAAGRGGGTKKDTDTALRFDSVDENRCAILGWSYKPHRLAVVLDRTDDDGVTSHRNAPVLVNKRA